MTKELQKIIQQKKSLADRYSKYGDIQRIGMEIPDLYIDLPEGPSCPIKLKPTKYPRTGKKLHKGMFMRKLGAFIHVYHIQENLYVVSLVDKSLEETTQWIDDSLIRIQERVILCKSTT